MSKVRCDLAGLPSAARRLTVLVVVTLLCACLHPTAEAQQSSLRKGTYLEAQMHYGRIVKHTSKLLFEQESNSVGLEVNLLFQTHGKKDWHGFHKFPLFGLSTYYYSLGNPDQLGHALAFVPNLTLKPIKRPSFDLIFQVGTGLAYLTRTFHRIDNPQNNAISSHWNNATAFKLGISWHLRPRWTLNAGGSFIHFSNGSTRLPNFGINVPAAYMGVRFRPNPVLAEDYKPQQGSDNPQRPWGVLAHTGMAYVEVLNIGGPRYPIYLASLGGYYHLSPYGRLQVGFEYEFNRGAYAFGKHTYSFTSEADARRRSGRYMIYAGYEFLFGPLGIQLQLGWYAGRQSILLRNVYYTKLISRYYLPSIGAKGPRPYLNVQLKSHLFNAEYVAFGLGMAF
ncbi:MAG: acyloxyacyl hydrolase [Bacteroidota bacterium]